VSKFKTKEAPEKEKTKENTAEPTKQQAIVIQSKTPQQMTYNVIDDLAKLRITFPFMEVVKIPQQRENILKILDDSNTRIEGVVMNSRNNKIFINETKG
jgi:hypothetical protein